MGLIQLVASLWPFLKEMFVGEKIKDSPSSRKGGGRRAQDNKKEQLAVRAARWVIGKMQTSRRFAATVVTVLLISLFINYKTIGKLTTLVPRQDDKTQTGAPPTKEPKELPTIPRKDSSERDVLYEQTVRELNNLYGETR